MSLKISGLSTKELKRLHIMSNRSWVSRQDIENMLAKSGMEADSESIDRVISDAELRPFSEGKYTTPEIYEGERAAVASAIARNDEDTHHIDPEIINQVLAENPHLREEQANAIKYAGKSGGVAALIGAAGSGKSTTLNVARQSFERSGRKVVGISPSGAAAIELQKSAGVESQTAFRFYSDVSSGKMELDENTVIFCDEAGMSDSLSLARVINESNKSGAKVILVGDNNQFESVSTASLFERICKETDAAEMVQIARQKDPEKQQISKDFYSQKGAQAVDKMNGLGMIHQAPPGEIKDALVNDYINYKAQGKSALVLASTNRDVAELNDKIVNQMIERGELKESESRSIEVTDHTGGKSKLDIYKNEEVMFRMSDASNGVVNGDTGTITELTENGFIAEIDRGNESFTAEVDLKAYDHIQPAYAMTTHKSQGSTVDKGFIAPSLNTLDSRAMYVASTRGREGAEVYIPESSLEQLKKASNRTITKTSTLDEYSEKESQEFAQYVDEIRGSRESLLGTPENSRHHFDELENSTKYNQLKREADVPEIKSLRELALKAAGATEPTKEGHVRSQAKAFGIGSTSEDKRRSIKALANSEVSEIEVRQNLLDRDDISRISNASKALKSTPEVDQFAKSEQGFSRWISDSKRDSVLAEVSQAHKEAIVERSQAAREYQSQVDQIYRSAGFSNTNSRNNAQASYAGEHFRGEASILTQNNRDYMLSLRDKQFSHSGRVDLGRKAFSLDNVWMRQHEKASSFRDAQSERLERGTVEGLLEYKHAKQMDDWSKKIAQGNGGSLSQQQSNWKNIEATISKDRQALKDLIKNSSSEQGVKDFSDKTGVVFMQDGSVAFKSQMSRESLRNLKQMEREQLANNPHMASIEYQRNPEAFRSQTEQGANKDLELQDFNKSENNQGGVQSGLSEREAQEQEEEALREQEVADLETQARESGRDQKEAEEGNEQEERDREDRERSELEEQDQSEQEDRARNESEQKAQDERESEEIRERDEQEREDRERAELESQEQSEREDQDRADADRIAQEERESEEAREREEQERVDREAEEQAEIEEQEQAEADQADRKAQEDLEAEEAQRREIEEQEVSEQESVEQEQAELEDQERLKAESDQELTEENDRSELEERERQEREDREAEEEQEIESENDSFDDSDDTRRSQEEQDQAEQARHQEEQDRSDMELAESERQDLESQEQQEEAIASEQEGTLDQNVDENALDEDQRQRVENLSREMDGEEVSQEDLGQSIEKEEIDRAREREEQMKEQEAELSPEDNQKYEDDLDKEREELIKQGEENQKSESPESQAETQQRVEELSKEVEASEQAEQEKERQRQAQTEQEREEARKRREEELER